MKQVSLIISAHNEGTLLWRTVQSCVESIVDLDYEIVVADDASNDGSIAELTKRIPRVRIVHSGTRLGASAGKDLAARNARGEVLVFLDSHTKPESGAIARLVRDVRASGGKALCTPGIATLDVATWRNDLQQVGHGYGFDLVTFGSYWLPLTKLTRSNTPGAGPLYESPAMIGCAFAITSEMYERMQGFDSQMRTWGVEDLDFSLKCWLMGGQILHDPGALIGHRFRDTFDNYSVPAEDVPYNELRMAFKNFTESVWEDWLTAARLRHAGNPGGYPEGLWARAWHLLQVNRPSAEGERSYLFARRPYDEFWYAKRFGLAWPRLAASGQLLPAHAVHASPAPGGSPRPSGSPPPPKCNVTGVTPAGASIFINQTQTFTAAGSSVSGVTWNAPGATPASGKGANFQTKWATTGSKTVTASCGGSSKSVTVRVLDIEIQINQTPAANDDLVQLNCLHPVARKTVPCRIRLLGPSSSAQSVVLVNPDGRLRFPNVANTTVSVSLPAAGGWAAFSISGQTVSTAIGDAKIVAHLGSAGGQTLKTKAVTVFTFDPSQMKLTQGGNYGFVGNTWTVPGGVAVNFSSSGTLKPAGLDCAAPQITKLRVGIMQESSAYASGTVWDTPTIAWIAATPSGTTIHVPNSMSQTVTYAPAVVQPVNDGLAGASPLYDNSATALTPPTGCAGGAAATSNDTPSDPTTTTFTLPITQGGTTVANATWTNRVKVTRKEQFRTFSVEFNTATNAFCALRQATWSLNADSTLANQKAIVNADAVASANPAIGVQANNAATQKTTAAVGAATTAFTKP